MAYLIATTEAKVRWYRFKGHATGVRRVPFDASLVGPFEIHDALDLGVIIPFETKDEAKLSALAVGLKTWRYVKI